MRFVGVDHLREALVGPVWDAEVDPVHRSDRAAVVSDITLATLGAAHSSAVAVYEGQADVRRDAARLATTRVPAGLGLCVVTAGSARVSSGAREATITAGDLCLVSGAVPFVKRVSPGYRGHFYLAPHDEIMARAGVSLEHAPLVVNGRDGFGEVLARQVSALAATAVAQLPPTVAANLFVATQNLIGAVFGSGAAADTRRETARELRKRRVLACIAERFREPDLDPAKIAAQCRISLRYLHALFAGEPSVSARLIAHRLEHCRRRLASPDEARTSIGDIAFDAGFNNLAHFSRTFKARFGMTPSEARSA